MSEKIYLWIEDRKDKASYNFWKIFLEQLYPEIQDLKFQREILESVGRSPVVSGEAEWMMIFAVWMNSG